MLQAFRQYAQPLAGMIWNIAPALPGDLLILR